jgi:hypothetical protein
MPIRRLQIVALVLLGIGGGAGGIAFAQDLPAPPSPPASVDATAFVDAFKGHQWALLAALVIYAFAALSKQGWLGTTLQAHLPKRMLPFLAPLTALLLLSTGEMIFGKIPWPTAILDGFIAGWLPIVGHQVVIESMRGGKELVPAKKPNGGSADPQVVKISVLPLAPAPPPRNERIAVRGLGIAVFTLVSAEIVFALFGAWLGVACTPQERAEIKTIADFVLSGSQLACVELSVLTTSKEVAQGCKIDLQAAPDVESFLDSLLSQKAAAQRSGFAWRGPPPRHDAGSL